MRRRAPRSTPSQSVEAGVALDDAAAGVGDEDLLVRVANLAGHLVELILRDEDANRAKLHDDVADAGADQARRPDVARGPGVRRALHDLVPLRERPARRQLGRVVAVRDRLRRIAAPGDGAHALGPEPDQDVVALVRDGHRQEPAGDAGERAEARAPARRGWRSRKGRP